MKKVFGRLFQLESWGDLDRLYNNVKKSDAFRGLKEDLEFIIQYWKKSGQPPSPSLLDKKGIKYEDSTEEITKLLKMEMAEIHQQLLKERLLTLVQSPALSGEEIMESITPLLPEQGKAITTTGSFNAQGEYNRRKETPVGLKFFIDVLDNEISGISYGTYTTLFGFVASLKTTAASNMAYCNSGYLGYKIAYITLEVPKEEFQFNLLSRHCFELNQQTQITAKRIKKALLTEEEEEFLFNTVVPSFKKREGEIYVLNTGDIIDKSSGTVTEMSFTRAMRKLYESNGLDAVIVDYINLMKYFKSSSSTEQGVNAFIAFLHELSLNFNSQGLIIIALAQSNREGWKKAVRKGGRYTLDALAEFNQLEQSSYYVVSLYYDEQLRASGEVKLQLLKHRAGSTIEEPFTTVAMPENFFVGDLRGYRESFTMDALEGLLTDE